MKVAAIKDAVEKFKERLRSNTFSGELHYLYEIGDRISHHYTSNSNTIEAIDDGLSSDHSVRLWKRQRYRPKEVFLQFGHSYPDFTAEALKDLFNEKKSLENRIDRFKFYCDELLSKYKSDHPSSTVNNHYVDESFISLLLMGLDPRIYAYYDHDLFYSVAVLTGANPIPTVPDYPRYLKLVKVFNTFIQKDERLKKFINQRNPSFANHANVGVECMTIACQHDLLE